MSSTIEQRLNDRGLQLPTPPAAVGAYVPAIRSGQWVITSGQLPLIGKELMFRGKVGTELSETDGANAAQLCTLNALAQIKALIGDLDRIRQIVRVEGYVQSAPGFHAQPLVLNGASLLLHDIFGAAGQHVRVAVGANELPLNAAVEVALWVEIAD